MPRQKYRRRKPRSRYQNYAGAAKQLYKDVKMLKDMVNVEYKYVEFETTGTPINVDSSCDSFCDNIVEGTDQDNRVGNSIKLQRLTGRGQVIKILGADEVTAAARLIVFIDKAAEFGTDSNTWDKIMVTSAAAGNKVLSFKDPDITSKTKVLFDKTFIFNGDEASDAPLLKQFTFNLPLNRHCKYDETEAVTLNDVKWMVIGDQATASLNIQLRMNAKLTYTDN